MKLAYVGVDGNGKTVNGTVEANDVVEAIEGLRRQGLFVTHVEPASEATTSSSAPRGTHKRAKLGRGKRLKYLAMFFRQLYVLNSSGTPLVQALGSLERQAKDPAWSTLVADVRQRVEQGETLSQAMEAHSEYFDAVARSLVAAGETGGELEQMLDRLSVLTRKQMQTRSAVLGAMIYPILLVFVAITVLVVMLTFVLPRFAGLFETLGAPLPPTTKMLVFLSNMLRSYWWGFLLAIGAGAFGIMKWSRTESGRRTLHTVAIHVPLFGPVFRSFAIARIIRVVGVLVNGKVTLLEALGLARQTAGNIHYADLVAKAEASVTRGSTVSASFAESDLINPSLVEAIRSGEQSGQIGNLMLNMADFMDEENEVIIRSLTSIIEPVILIVLGLLVGFVALSMFLPLFDLTSMTQRG